MRVFSGQPLSMPQPLHSNFPGGPPANPFYMVSNQSGHFPYRGVLQEWFLGLRVLHLESFRFNWSSWARWWPFLSSESWGLFSLLWWSRKSRFRDDSWNRIMRNTEQIDALTLMVSTPFVTLSSPDSWRVSFPFLWLSSIFNVVGIFGGYLIGVRLLGVGVWQLLWRDDELCGDGRRFRRNL